MPNKYVCILSAMRHIHRERLLLMHQRNSKMHEMAHSVCTHTGCGTLHFIEHTFCMQKNGSLFVLCAYCTRCKKFLNRRYILNSAKSYVNELMARQRDALLTASASAPPFTITLVLGAIIVIIIIIDSRICTHFAERLCALRHCIRCARCCSVHTQCMLCLHSNSIMRAQYLCEPNEHGNTNKQSGKMVSHE